MNKSEYISLYNDTDKKILKIAEDSLNPKLDRLQEIMEFATEAEIRTIGIANCIALKKEADFVEHELTQNGFKVFNADCKLGKIPFGDLLEGYKGVSCNPAGQAKYLGENKTELNIMMGLCVGHDMIFNMKSEAPVTPLVVKDRKNKHKTVDILK